MEKELKIKYINGSWEVVEATEPTKGKSYFDLEEAQNLAKSYNEGTTLVCKECGKEFAVTQEEEKWYTDVKGFDLPKRCPTCRRNRRKPIDNN